MSIIHQKGTTMTNPATPSCHPVIVVIVGTTMTEIALILFALGMGGCANFIIIVVDSIEYDLLVLRLVQSGWSEDDVKRVIPRSRYFQLDSPFDRGFDFSAPLNATWKRIIHEPALERIAQDPSSPGCAGTPAMGRARAESCFVELGTFFRQAIQELTQIRTEALALKPGVLCHVVTTLRGGTGTGATEIVGAALRAETPSESRIILRLAMPDIYLGDTRASANSHATIHSLQADHRFGHGVTMHDGRILRAPFDLVIPTFVSDGALSLKPLDVLRLQCETLASYLDPEMQSAILAREVDCTDVVPYDLGDLPTHIATETALSIETLQPGTFDYLASRVLYRAIEESSERFERYVQEPTLTPAEEKRVEAVVTACNKEVDLSIKGLLTRIESTPSLTNLLRSHMEKVRGAVSGMDAEAVKRAMKSLVPSVQELFARTAPVRETNVLRLARELPEAIKIALTTRLPSEPHLRLAALSRIADHLEVIARDAEREARNAKQVRDRAGADLGSALSQVQESRGVLGILRKDEVARDAASRSLDLALRASLARASQEAFEALVRALHGEISTVDAQGKPLAVPSVVPALRRIFADTIAEVRTWNAEQRKVLARKLDDSARKFETRSEVFQRCLVHDRASRESLDADVDEFRREHGDVPPVHEFMSGKITLDEALQNLLPHLPAFTDSGRTLTDIILSDPEKQREISLLLRSARPFVEIDPVVEDQQGLKNRRDNLTILTLPGGADGPLAELMIREGVVENRNQIVESGSAHEIRIYKLRLGLPYYAIKSLRRFKDHHDRYLASPGAISPYSTAGSHLLPPIEAPKTNLVCHTTGLLAAARAVLPERVVEVPSGWFMLRYEREASEGFTTTAEERFPDFESMVRWVASHPTERKWLEAALKDRLDQDPASYKSALVEAWCKAEGAERTGLEEALFALRVDPRERAVPATKRGRPKGSGRKATAVEEVAP